MFLKTRPNCRTVDKILTGAVCLTYLTPSFLQNPKMKDDNHSSNQPVHTIDGPHQRAPVLAKL